MWAVALDITQYRAYYMYMYLGQNLPAGSFSPKNDRVHRYTYSHGIFNLGYIHVCYLVIKLECGPRPSMTRVNGLGVEISSGLIS